MQAMPTLADKTALVLGGSRGIGAAIVERLAADGAAVTFTYAGNASAAEAVAARTGARAVQADAADRAATARVIAGIGRLDLLVVNAGIAVFGDALDNDPEAVDRLIDVNVRGPWHAAVLGAKAMDRGGRIVLIGSVNGDRMPFAGGAAYALTKSALQGMTRGLARDLGPRGITVNTVQPGPVDTDLNPADGPMKDLMHSFMAIRRHATAAEIAGMVAYLVGPEAGIVTGALHTIDGGFGA
jgi:cyclic-di-GMP-binding biofilm dispersal mediator protein